MRKIHTHAFYIGVRLSLRKLGLTNLCLFFYFLGVITSYLLIAHDKSLRRALSQSSRPKTHFQRYNFEKTIHAGGISQIATMPDYTLVSEDTSRMDTQPDTK
jgi:hypothetical protein